jgi:aminopeptidase
MIDPRVEKLADVLVGYSVNVQPGENVLIETYDIPDEVIAAVVQRVYAAGGRPFTTVKRNSVLRALYSCASEEQMALTGKLERERMSKMQCYIGIRGALNIAEHSDVADDRLKLYRKHWWNPVHSEQRVKHTKWVVLRFPSASMAQQANMSTEQFEKFYFDVCTFDYSKMDKPIAPLRDLMNSSDKVRITGPGTDLTFSIKGIGAVPCIGNMNVPDGECYTAPVKDSVEGTISYNAPTIYQGTVFDSVVLTFRKGKIVDAVAGGGNTQRLNEILNSDEGARYVGEFSFGFNPYILEPMKENCWVISLHSRASVRRCR